MEQIAQAGQVLSYLNTLELKHKQQACKQYKSLHLADQLSTKDTFYQAELARIYECKSMKAAVKRNVEQVF